MKSLKWKKKRKSVKLLEKFQRQEKEKPNIVKDERRRVKESLTREVEEEQAAGRCVMKDDGIIH